MTNPRGPMVPHEVRVRLDQARLFDSCGESLHRLARVIRGEHLADVEQAVVEAEAAIKQAQIEIKRMKDEPSN